MRYFILFIMLYFASPVLSQSLNGPHNLPSGTGQAYNHSSSDSYKYISYEIFLPSGSIGIVGFQRRSGQGDNDIRIGTSISPKTYYRASVSGVVASDTSDDSSPDLLIFTEKNFSSRRFFIEAWSSDNKDGRWAVRYSTFNIAEQMAEALIFAGIQMAAECLLIGCGDSAESDVQENLGRAFNLGQSVLTRNNICAVGTDVIANEISNELNREIPDARFVVLVLTNMMKNFVAKVAYVQCPT